MKKYIPASFLALACACAYGATLTGGTSAANATSFGDYSSDSVTLNPPPAGSTGYFNGNNQTAKSVILGGNASVSGGFNVDFYSEFFGEEIPCYAIDATNGNITLTNGSYAVKSTYEGEEDILVNTASGKTFTIASDATFNSKTDDSLLFQGGGAYNVAGTLNANSFDLRGSTLTQTGKVTVGEFYISNRSGDAATKYTVMSGGELYTDSISMRGSYAEYNLRIEGYLKNTGEIEVGAQFKKKDSTEPEPAALSIAGTVDTHALNNAGAIVDISGTLNVNELTVNTTATSKLNVWNTGVVNINGNSSLTEVDLRGSMNINAGTSTIRKADAMTLMGGKLTVKNGAKIEVAGYTQTGNPYAMLIGNGDRASEIYVQSGGLIDLTKASGGNDLSIGNFGSGAKLTVKADNEHAIYLNKICVRDYSAELTINSKNIFRSKDVVSDEKGYNIMFLMASNAKLTMNLNAEAHFGNLIYQNDDSLLTINMGSASDIYLSFNDILLSYVATTANIVFNDFNNNRIFFESMSEFHDYVTISATSIDGKKLTKDDFRLVAGDFNGKTVYWLHSNLVVPEPAEWAAIFGAIALGLAAWKRRRRA